MTHEQSALFRKARKNVRAAKLLLEDYLYDISVSGHIMPCFIASTFLLSKELTFSGHSAVIAAFGKHFTKTGELPAKFHRYLIELMLTIGFFDRCKEKTFDKMIKIP